MLLRVGRKTKERPRDNGTNNDNNNLSENSTFRQASGAVVFVVVGVIISRGYLG